MSRWWRAYDEAVDDPKLCLLSDKQHRAWFNLCCITSQNDGKLPTIAAVAFKLRMTVDKAKALVAELVALGLIDNDDGIFAPHNWGGRQYKTDIMDPTTAIRSKRYRDKRRDADRDEHRDATVTVTDTRADTEQITETEQRKKTRAGALAGPWCEADWDQFWEAYPHKIGKSDARKAFEKASKKTTPDVVFPALRQYAAKTDDRPFCNPSTWLNQERWLDRPAIISNGRRTVQQAADDLLAKLKAFDDPAPDGLCNGEGQDAIRLLPPNRRS